MMVANGEDVTLRALATAVRADHREWVFDKATRDYDDGFVSEYAAVRVQAGRAGSWEVAEVHHEPEARFIAAASPAVVLGLLEQMDRLREALGDDEAHGAAERHLQDQKDRNAALLAENDRLHERNSRLRGALQDVVHSHDRCARIVAEFDSRDAEAPSESGSDARGAERL